MARHLWTTFWIVAGCGLVLLASLFLNPGLAQPPRGEPQPAPKPGDATKPQRERWEYAVLTYDPGITSVEQQRFTWEGPVGKPIQADGSEAITALAAGIKLPIQRNSLPALLTALGGEGWELVTRNYRETTTGPLEWTFKRRKESR